MKKNYFIIIYFIFNSFNIFGQLNLKLELNQANNNTGLISGYYSVGLTLNDFYNATNPSIYQNIPNAPIPHGYIFRLIKDNGFPAGFWYLTSEAPFGYYQIDFRIPINALNPSIPPCVGQWERTTGNTTATIIATGIYDEINIYSTGNYNCACNNGNEGPKLNWKMGIPEGNYASCFTNFEVFNPTNKDIMIEMLPSDNWVGANNVQQTSIVPGINYQIKGLYHYNDPTCLVKIKNVGNFQKTNNVPYNSASISSNLINVCQGNNALVSMDFTTNNGGGPTWGNSAAIVGVDPLQPIPSPSYSGQVIDPAGLHKRLNAEISNISQTTTYYFRQKIDYPMIGFPTISIYQNHCPVTINVPTAPCIQPNGQTIAGAPNLPNTYVTVCSVLGGIENQVYDPVPYNNGNFILNALTGPGEYHINFHEGATASCSPIAPSNYTWGGEFYNGVPDLTTDGRLVLIIDANGTVSTGRKSALSPISFAFAPTGPLPVKLISFNAKAQENQVLLNWSTSSEINSAGFYIERSENGKNFDKIGFVKSNGNSNEKLGYSFIDNAPPALGGEAYYRLRMLDSDGKFEYSQTKFVKIESKESIKIFPNPTTDFVNIQSFGTNIKSVELLNTKGSVIYRENKAVDIIDLNGKAPGIYFLRIEKIDGKVVGRKVLKN